MASRGQKRPESADELPADKRACSSMESSNPSSENSQPQIADNASETEILERDTETSSPSISLSGQSEDDTDIDGYNEDGPDGYRNGGLVRVQSLRSQIEQQNITPLIPVLNDQMNPSVQLAVLTEICELLSFSTGDTLSNLIADQLAAAFVKLANNELNPDILLLCMRAITYLCDIYPLGPAHLVRHNVVPALCQRLTVIEYMDVAEQCLQALKNISRDQPLVCLQSGAIMAVLGFIDFFSTSNQRTALATVVNICKKIPSDSECPGPFIEAVPRLCDLLHFEDQQLVESAITCLIKIADRAKDSPEKLNELCKKGLIEQTVDLIGAKSRTLSETTYASLIGLLAKLVPGSSDAVSIIFKLDIGNLLKDCYFSHSDLKHNNQVHEVLRLLNVLLPPTIRNEDEQLLSPKEKILADNPDGLLKFGMQVLPSLIQVVRSGTNISVCYGCLSVISKLVYHSKSYILLEMIESTGMPSFLMGVLTRKDYDNHILTIALEITEMVLQKLCDSVIASFAKEGVFFAINAFLTSENCSVFMFSSASESSAPSDSIQKKCLCYAYSTDDRVSAPELKACKLDKDSALKVAKRIREKYIAAALQSLGSLDTDLLKKLRVASNELTNSVNNIRNGGSKQAEENLNSILHQVMVIISGDEPISIFELIESGIIKALVNYLYVGFYDGEKVDLSNVFANFHLLLERFKVFAALSVSSLYPALADSPLSLLVRKLQIALSTLESFPAASAQKTKRRMSHVSIPRGRHVAYTCLNVRFKRAETEKNLGDYSETVFTVDPFCSVEAIKSYLCAKIAKRNSDRSRTPSLSFDGSAIPDILESNNSVSAKSPELEEERDDPTQTANLASMDIDGPGSVCKPSIGFAKSELSQPMEVDDESNSLRKGTGTSIECSSNMECSLSDVCSDIGNDFSRLEIYLEGSELGNSSTLYHEVLLQRMKSQDLHSGSDVWSEVYTLTYKNAADTGNGRLCQQYFPFSYDFIGQKVSSIVRSSPTNDILFLLRSLEIINRHASYLGHSERVSMFAEGKCSDLYLKSMIPKLSVNEFLNRDLSEKLEEHMRNPLTVSIGALPLWCNWLMSTCPFLFTLELRRRFFQLAAFERSYYTESHQSRDHPERMVSSRGLPRKKFLVSRKQILESATEIMDKHTEQNVVLEVAYHEEVGSGLGPTLEFYTLVCHEFQKPGLGMWRGDHQFTTMTSSAGFFPRPWSKRTDTSNGTDMSDVIKRFSLLGWIVAKALQDRRVLDIPFSKAFYKLILGQDLSLYDIQSFDPEFGQTLLEFHAIVSRQRFCKNAREEGLTVELDLSFHGVRVEDLSLDFTLPGYPDYVLADKEDHSVVTIGNLEQYVYLVVDATINAGIYLQVEAFKSGFNKVFPISHLQVFNEDELDSLLCGERDSWVSTELLDHIKVDHGYTASSTAIKYLMEIIQELNYEQRRAFLQFVTGAPRLPPGGLGALDPKLTIVRKHCSDSSDSDLPSVMTCANYLKLPSYSSKERMKDKLLYAITEGQGSFHLS